VWQRVIDELAAIPDLRNIHFMGGETLITPRFRDFVDHMTQKQRFDLNFSFVTNGTTFDSELMDKLMKFGRVGIEVSIETVTPHNAYQRQGTDTAIVLSNIERYLKYCDNQRVTLTVRPALSLLTIGNYHTLLEYCLEKQLLVKSLLVSRPRYLDIALLPELVKQQYRQRYLDMIQRQQLNDDSTISDFNESDPNHCRQIVLNEARQVLSLLDQPTPDDSKQQFDELVNWCQRWDNIYNYNALELYPELADILTTHGYKKI
jgi:sulfatase maturation enzyme AslB (radical SAM superfamily)